MPHKCQTMLPAKNLYFIASLKMNTIIALIRILIINFSECKENHQEIKPLESTDMSFGVKTMYIVKVLEV